MTSLWQAFDDDKSDEVNFGEFVLGLNAMSKGDTKSKLKLSFDVYDVDGTGKISKDEMITVLRSFSNSSDTSTAGAATPGAGDGSPADIACAYDEGGETQMRHPSTLKGRSGGQDKASAATSAAAGNGDESREHELKAFVDSVFASSDRDDSGTLTYLEYLKAAMNYPHLLTFSSSGGE